MSLKLNFSNSHALEGSHTRQRTCAEPNFEFCVHSLTTNQTWGMLTNSGHTVWALFMLKFYMSSTIYQCAYSLTRHQISSHAQNVMPYMRLSAHLPYLISSSTGLLRQQFQPGLFLSGLLNIMGRKSKKSRKKNGGDKKNKLNLLLQTRQMWNLEDTISEVETTTDIEKSDGMDQTQASSTAQKFHRWGCNRNTIRSQHRIQKEKGQKIWQQHCSD